jgi:HEAT repeat protein
MPDWLPHEITQNRKDADAVRREIGADILGQLGRKIDVDHGAFHAESVSILISLLGDPVPDVIASAAYSLAHRGDAAAVPELVKQVAHPSDRVRHRVTFGLLGHDDLGAIQALIALSRDEDEDVRNWAIFGLGSHIDSDSDAIRQALIDRLSEADQEIRGEALYGLAKRAHPGIVDWLIRELSGETIDYRILEACEMMANPRLFPLLQEWKECGFEGKDDPFLEGHLDAALAVTNPSK